MLYLASELSTTWDNPKKKTPVSAFVKKKRHCIAATCFKKVRQVLAPKGHNSSEIVCLSPAVDQVGRFLRCNVGVHKILGNISGSVFFPSGIDSFGESFLTWRIQERFGGCEMARACQVTELFVVRCRMNG